MVMRGNEQWREDLNWLLENEFVGFGGQTELWKALCFLRPGLSRIAVHTWCADRRRPNYVNQQALRALRQIKQRDRDMADALRYGC